MQGPEVLGEGIVTWGLCDAKIMSHVTVTPFTAHEQSLHKKQLHLEQHGDWDGQEDPFHVIYYTPLRSRNNRKWPLHHKRSNEHSCPSLAGIGEVHFLAQNCKTFFRYKTALLSRWAGLNVVIQKTLAYMYYISLHILHINRILHGLINVPVWCTHYGWLNKTSIIINIIEKVAKLVRLASFK